jgi:hypothetical protein
MPRWRFPAHLAADPLPAPVALVEVRLHLVHGLGQGLVAGRPADAVPHPLGIPADLGGLLADGAADQVAAHLQEPAAEPGDGVLERGHVAVPAVLAEELELIPLAGAPVLVVVRKEDHLGQVALFPRQFRPTAGSRAHIIPARPGESRKNPQLGETRPPGPAPVPAAAVAPRRGPGYRS